jgi:DNA-binding Xre family transcriptional regulator
MATKSITKTIVIDDKEKLKRLMDAIGLSEKAIKKARKQRKKRKPNE